MTGFRHVAVIDVGKTNAKLALVDVEKMEEIAVERRPNRVLYSTPWPHFDLDGLWDFFSSGLTHLHRAHGIDAISVTTHGASGVLLDASGRVAAPMLDYEHTGPDGLRRNYDRARPPFSETGAPRLGGGLNLGAQFYWQFVTDPGLKDRTTHVVTYPQYWGFRLTGQIACDVCSLGCHTDLWNPWSGKFSTLVERLGLSAKMAPPMRPDETLGPVTPGIANRLCLTRGTLVSVGIHDSNASLLPYLTSRTSPFAVVSTGTWVIAMAIGGAKVTLKPERDTLVNVNAFGHPVPSARFMGGREYEEIVKGSTAIPSAADRSGVLENGVMLLPAVEPASGPFQGRRAEWTVEPRTDGERLAAAAFYLALMTETCLHLTGAEGPTIVEGPLAMNEDFCSMLAALRPDAVETAASATGTSAGAALLLATDVASPPTKLLARPTDSRFASYAEEWFARAGGHGHLL